MQDEAQAPRSPKGFPAPFGPKFPSAPNIERPNVGRMKRRLLRTKSIQDPCLDDDKVPVHSLRKCLTTFDLVSLGVGSCCGTGMYVVAGMVAKKVAGPGVILSFIIAAIASILSGVCYAEFGVRVPRTTGSAYMYSYVTVGEFVAFMIGWNLILEYLIGTAAGASAISACLDALANHTISDYMMVNVGTVIGKAYPDFIGFAIAIVMTLILAVGVKKSIIFNNILNCLNFIVWVFMIIAGLCFVDTSNWSMHGFLPFGFSGVFSGAATCFYAFIGFDIIATTGEEANNPSRDIPIAIVSSLMICLVAYVSVSVVCTLMVPYYALDQHSALIDMFVQVGLPWAKYVIAIGAIAALTVSLLGSMFPMPRVIFAMSRDGLLFKSLAKINPRTETPLIATVIAGVLAALMSLLVGLQALVEMMSIGTLLAYTLVSVSVLILRYAPDKTGRPSALGPKNLDPIEESPPQTNWPTPADMMVDQEFPEKAKYKDDEYLIPGGAPDQKSYGSFFNTQDGETRMGWLRRNTKILSLKLGFPGDECVPNNDTARTVTRTVMCLAVIQTALCCLIIFGGDYIVDGAAWAIVIMLVLMFAIIGGLVVILRQPQNHRRLKFMAPCVPILPLSAMLINIYLMLKLSPLTWIRFGVWLLIGLFAYFGYGMWNSAIESRYPSDIPIESREGEDADPVVIEKINPFPTESTVIPAHAENITETHAQNTHQRMPNEEYSGVPRPHAPPGAPNGTRPDQPRYESSTLQDDARDQFGQSPYGSMYPHQTSQNYH